MHTPTMPARPTTLVPAVPPMLPPGYGVMHLQDAWYPCRLRHGKPVFLPASPLDLCPFIRCEDYQQALAFCMEEAALEDDECQPLRNMERYPDRIEEMEQWVCEHTGWYPCWWLQETGGIYAGIHLGDEVVPAIFAHGDSLCEALTNLCTRIEQRQQEAELRAWEAWWHETVPVR